MRKFIYLIIIGIAILGCGQKKSEQDSSQDTQNAFLVKTVATKDLEVPTTLSYSGEVEPVLTVPLSFQLPGTVMQIYADEGDHVRQGQLLAELDKTSYRSSYHAALAKQKQAQDAYNRMKIVYDNGSLPEIRWEETKANLEQANSFAKIAKKNLENCDMTSPLNGIVGMRKLEKGTNVTPEVPVFRVITMKDIYVRISVPENEINKMQKGQAASVTFPAFGEKIFNGIVEKIGIEANQVSKTYEVKIRIENKDLGIKPGMVCDINLPLRQVTTGLLVPVKAVLKDEYNKNYVYVADRQTGKAKRQDVKTGGIINNQLTITSGLTPGDLLIIEGQQKLTNGSPIRFN